MADATLPKRRQWDKYFENNLRPMRGKTQKRNFYIYIFINICLYRRQINWKTKSNIWKNAIIINNYKHLLQPPQHTPDVVWTTRVALKAFLLLKLRFLSSLPLNETFQQTIPQLSVRDSQATWTVTSMLLKDLIVTCRRRVVVPVTWQWRETDKHREQKLANERSKDGRVSCWNIHEV